MKPLFNIQGYLWRAGEKPLGLAVFVTSMTLVGKGDVLPGLACNLGCAVGGPWGQKV